MRQVDARLWPIWKEADGGGREQSAGSSVCTIKCRCTTGLSEQTQNTCEKVMLELKHYGGGT